MAEYTWADTLTDVLALIGLIWIVASAWEEIEVYLYGYSQASIVDCVFVAVFCVFAVAILRCVSMIMHGG